MNAVETNTGTTRADEASRAATTTLWSDRSSVDGSTLVLMGVGVNDIWANQDGTIRSILPTLSAHAARHGMETWVYSLAGGLRGMDAPGGPAAEIPSGVDAGTPATIAIDVVLNAARMHHNQTQIVFDFADGLLANDTGPLASPDAARILEQLASPGADPRWAATGNRIVIIGRAGSVDSRLTSIPGVRVLDLGLPALSERRAAIVRMQESPRHPLFLEIGLTVDKAAQIMGGLSLDEISRMRLQSDADHPMTVTGIVDAKKDAIRRLAGDSLLIHDEQLSLDTDVAGLPQIRRAVLEEMRRGNLSLRFILSGPPGVGKTRVSTAIAARLGVPALELGRILGRFVGESEDNLNLALSVIESCAPALLIIDEAEAAGLGRRGEVSGTEGSEVTASLRAKLFTWLGDVGERLGIAVLALTNMPQLLDPASIDRFTVLPVLHPTPLESAQIMTIQGRREGIDLDVEGARKALVAARVSFSGRQAVRLLASAQVHAQEQGRDDVWGEDVEAAIADSMDSIGPEEERQSLLAVAATSWQRHFPWNAAVYMGEQNPVIPDYLVPFVREDGSVDLAKLNQRIHELGPGHAA